MAIKLNRFSKSYQRTKTTTNMKHQFFAVFSISLYFLTMANAHQTKVGEFSRVIESDGRSITEQLLVSGNYFTITAYETASGAFISTEGGMWIDKNVTYEFHTKDKTKVGTTEQWKSKHKKDKLILKRGKSKTTWQSIEKEVPTLLTSAWLIAGRKRKGEMRMRDTDKPRKTMKILTLSHFQWIAYNTETGEFFGTGGGSYTAKDGKYVEQIEFFSRDNSRVGAELKFDFEVKDGDWHHSGLSSKGKPIYEVWKARK